MPYKYLGSKRLLGFLHMLKINRQNKQQYTKITSCIRPSEYTKGSSLVPLTLAV